jgi:hypothetical protein
MRQCLRLIILFLLFFVFSAKVVSACGYDFWFRTYLDKRFWQPFSKYEEALGKQTPMGDTREKDVVFAGMSEGGPLQLQTLRRAYRTNDLMIAREGMSAALQEAATENEKEEIGLIDSKLDMREGEQGKPDMLKRAESKLRDFLTTAKMPAWRSEARGWLARVYYLSGNYSSAAKIYLDEFSQPDSIFDRDSLMTSLRILFPYNGSGSRLADHLEEYFDTPAHALFAITIVTNPVYFDESERASMAEVAGKTIDVLQRRHDLFTAGSESDALAMALMRAAIYMGDTRAALEYSKRISANSDIAGSPDFNWMVGSCYFLQRDYAMAEFPLLKMHGSFRADFRARSAAAQGLMGVYEKLGRRVDQLHAAFLAAQNEGGEKAGESYDGFHDVLTYWPIRNARFDLAYLLDVKLTDEELRDYLRKYKDVNRSLVIKYWARGRTGPYGYIERKRSADEVVRYALAVRYARHERYEEAGRIFGEIQAFPRAERMSALTRLHARTVDRNLSEQQRLEALFAYGSFLEEHSTQVFFNDMFWSGLQTWSFLGKKFYGAEGFPSPTDAQGLTREERESSLAQERRIKDEQEERWRAYEILINVAQKAGRSELGIRATAKALRCLRLINTGRFGREEEIDSAVKRLESSIKLGRSIM